jgi:competence protein CoiA
MLSAHNKHGEDMVAWEATKADGPFSCPACHEEVLLKKGSIKEHHFAHVPPSACPYGTGESEEHRQAKHAIYEALQTHPNISWVRVEWYLGEVRPDINFTMRDGQEVAVEIQFSPLSPEETARRTRLYSAKRIHVLWLLPARDHLIEGAKYDTSLLERYLHALYFGKVYYWLSGDLVLPVHFERYSLGLALREWDAQEEEEQGHASFFERFSKRARIPTFLDAVHIAELQAMSRQAGQFGPYALPTAWLWGENAWRS